MKTGIGTAYNVAMVVANMALNIFAPFNKKLAKGKAGRKNIFDKLREAIHPNDQVIWFHSASLGEYEQGKPIIDLIKAEHPGYKILITFFSPSGYEVIKPKNTEDLVFYLPFDTKSNVTEFVEIVNPQIAFFIKYEFWFNYLQELQRKHVPTIFISSIFREDQYFFSWYGKWFLNIVKNIDFLFVQDENSKQLLTNQHLSNAIVIGDTRLDRVLEKANRKEPIDLVERFKGENKLLIVGSSWSPDIDVLMPFLNKQKENIKCLIAPHEVGDNNIESIIKQFNGKAIRYSKLTKENAVDNDLLIIDNIGILSNLYQYGDVTYIGGGFGDGIHNLQEPASHSQPLIFGPKYGKFKEATELIKLGAATSISNGTEFETTANMLLSDDKLMKTKGLISADYIKNNAGATTLVSEKIKILLS